MSTVHAANERIPVDALQFGVDALFELGAKVSVGDFVVNIEAME
ncbi:MAG: hypothetical protein R2911_10790 [Caldilineaceae bacterium]